MRFLSLHQWKCRNHHIFEWDELSPLWRSQNFLSIYHNSWYFSTDLPEISLSLTQSSENLSQVFFRFNPSQRTEYRYSTQWFNSFYGGFCCIYEPIWLFKKWEPMRFRTQFNLMGTILFYLLSVVPLMGFQLKVVVIVFLCVFESSYSSVFCSFVICF